MASVEGHCDDRFASVRESLASRLTSSAELGASICVTINGKTVVDIWGGHATPARDQPWTRDTITPVWSVSKTISALAVLLLIDRGQLHPDDPVAKHWPEFDTDDKRSILVRHCLAHTAGLPSWDPPLPTKELFDIPLATSKLLAQKPWWEPGTASGYHLISQGFLLGGIVYRVSGKPLSEFVRDELALPLNADFHLGLHDESQWPRIAELDPPPPFPREALVNAEKENKGAPSIATRAFLGYWTKAEHTLLPEFRRSGIGSVGGFSNARGFNKILEIITHRGTIEGKQFLKPETVDLIFQTQAEGPDLVIGFPLKMGMGFGLANGMLDWIPEGKICYWGGWGGSLAIMDLDRGVTFTYAMNKMENGTLGNSNTEAYVREVYRVLNEVEGKASL
ncbi:hypothetical protein BDV12DRAFT_11836 [Aspergillus spectabilis]